MGRLIYSMIASLDGYVEDEGGSFSWAAPGEEVFAFVNDLERDVGTYLYGRRMYETMRYWESDEAIGDEPTRVEEDFTELWRAADKVVYSRSLDEVRGARTRLEREFDPEAVRAMKATLERDLTVSGPELAAQACRAGLVDELQLFMVPVVVGGGKPALPAGVRLELELRSERRFANGVVFVRYATFGGRCSSLSQLPGQRAGARTAQGSLRLGQGLPSAPRRRSVGSRPPRTAA